MRLYTHGGDGKEEGGWGRGRGELTCGYPLPLTPTDPPDDVIAHQRVLALLQPQTILIRHKSTIQFDAVVAPQVCFESKNAWYWALGISEFGFTLRNGRFSTKVMSLHPKKLIHRC